MKEPLRGIAAGIGASVLGYLLTVVLAVPFLPRILARGPASLEWASTGVTDGELDPWAMYEAAGQPLLNAVTWVFTGTHGMRVQFAMPGASGEAPLALGTAPWVMLAGPVACFLVGAVLGRRRAVEGIGISTTAGFVAVGYTVSLYTLAAYADVTANERAISMVLNPVSFPPWLVVVPTVAFVFGSVGIVAGARRWWVPPTNREPDTGRDAGSTERYRRFRETTSGLAASVLAYLFTVVFAGPWLPEIFSRIRGPHRETYLAIDPPAWKEVVWVFLNTYQVPLAFSGPRWMGGGTDLALDIAPWVYLAGPTACFAVGTLLARRRPERHPAAIGAFLTVGYTLSLFVLSFTVSSASSSYIIEARAWSAAPSIPPVIVIVGITLLTSTLGVLAGKRVFDDDQ